MLPVSLIPEPSTPQLVPSLEPEPSVSSSSDQLEVPANSPTLQEISLPVRPQTAREEPEDLIVLAPDHSKLSLKELKRMCEKKNLDSSGRKVDLIERINAHK